MSAVYVMDIENPAGVVKQHGFHLGTDLRVAESFVYEQLNKGAVSVALRLGNKLVRIYDATDIRPPKGWEYAG